jgi:hypothetical protein
MAVNPRIDAYRRLLDLLIKHVPDDATIVEIMHCAHDVEDAVRAEEQSSVRDANLTARVDAPWRVS